MYGNLHIEILNMKSQMAWEGCVNEKVEPVVAGI